jgi:integrase
VTQSSAVEPAVVTERPPVHDSLADPAQRIAAGTRLSILSTRLTNGFEATLRQTLGEHIASKRTLTLYAKDLMAFFEYAAMRRQCRLPATPDLVADFLIAQVEPQRRRATSPKVQTMNRRATAISTLHRLVGLDNPCHCERVRKIRVGLRHQWGYRAPSHGRFGPDLLLRVVGSIDDGDLATLRDRALFLVAFAAGLGPDDIRRLAVADLSWTPRLLTIRRSTAEIHIEREDAEFAEFCPVRALEAWLGASGIAAGPIFRPVRLSPAVSGRDAAAPPMTYQGLAQIIKSRLKAAGIPTTQHNVGAIRVGFLSSAYSASLGPFSPQAPVRLSRFYP